MLTKFDTLYTGHVDLDDVGYGGTPVMERDFPNEHLVTALRALGAGGRTRLLLSILLQEAGSSPSSFKRRARFTATN